MSFFAAYDGELDSTYGSDWTDQTEHFKSLCSALDDNQPMLSTPNFKLADTIHAVELGDPKMDQLYGLGYIDPHTIMNPSFPDLHHWSLTSIITILKSLIIYEAQFLDGMAALDCTHKCIYLWGDSWPTLHTYIEQHPNHIYAQILYTYCRHLHQSLHAYQSGIVDCDIFEEDDLIPTIQIANLWTEDLDGNEIDTELISLMKRIEEDGDALFATASTDSVHHDHAVEHEKSHVDVLHQILSLRLNLGHIYNDMSNVNVFILKQALYQKNLAALNMGLMEEGIRWHEITTRCNTMQMKLDASYITLSTLRKDGSQPMTSTPSHIVNAIQPDDTVIAWEKEANTTYVCQEHMNSYVLPNDKAGLPSYLGHYYVEGEDTLQSFKDVLDTIAITSESSYGKQQKEYESQDTAEETLYSIFFTQKLTRLVGNGPVRTLRYRSYRDSLTAIAMVVSELRYASSVIKTLLDSRAFVQDLFNTEKEKQMAAQAEVLVKLESQHTPLSEDLLERHHQQSELKSTMEARRIVSYLTKSTWTYDLLWDIYEDIWSHRAHDYVANTANNNNNRKDGLRVMHICARSLLYSLSQLLCADTITFHQCIYNSMSQSGIPDSLLASPVVCLAWINDNVSSLFTEFLKIFCVSPKKRVERIGLYCTSMDVVLKEASQHDQDFQLEYEINDKRQTYAFLWLSKFTTNMQLHHWHMLNFNDLIRCVLWPLLGYSAK